MNGEKELIEALRTFPARLSQLVSGLSDEQLTTHYLPNEWTVAQNVHHLADSHINSYIRCKLIATEDHPPLKPYDQDAWAMMVDGQSADLSTSLALLSALHTRWAQFWENLPSADWDRTGYHPENGAMSLRSILPFYVAHGDGHIDQINRTLAANQ